MIELNRTDTHLLNEIHSQINSHNYNIKKSHGLSFKKFRLKKMYFLEN